MQKIFHVALREFVTTVFTKAFILGIVLPPMLMALVFGLIPLLMNKAAPKVEGHLAIIDRTGVVAQKVEHRLSPEETSKRSAEKLQRAADASPLPDDLKKKVRDSITSAPGVDAPRGSLSVMTLPADADVEAAKAQIRATIDGMNQAETPQSGTESTPRLALAVIPKEAITPDASGVYAGLDLFTAPRLDAEIEGDVQSQLARAVVDARIEAKGLSVADVRLLTGAPTVNVKAVTAEGETTISSATKMLVPGAFMLLLWISVFTCGNYLLTTTIEEKSSRVMEVLLSAVSPMQLMTGKIVGQMFVGVLILMFYSGAGLAALAFAAKQGLIDPLLFVYLGIYFVIAFAMIAALMAAVGSAVSDVREAQSLLGPVMIVLMIPMMLWLPIMRNPNSAFAQICSFVPPISPFVMVLRLAGSEPVPTWQIIASILAGCVYVLVFLWAAAKVFRIGVLMYGKPPNFATLIRWVRMA